MTGLARHWRTVLASGIGVAVLVGLAAWQIERLAWKQGLIARLNERQMMAPVALADVPGDDIDFLKVKVRGHYLGSGDKLLISTFDGNPAWEVVSPFVSSDGTLILVDRGVVPDGQQSGLTPPAGEIEVTGVLLRHDAARGFFAPANDPKANLWFWWDVPAMLAATAVPAGVAARPLVLHIPPTDADRGFPRPQAPAPGLANNHLQYAITWLGLALALAVITGLYLRGQMKKSSA